MIECQPCTKHRVLKLLDILPSRGPQAFDVFLQSLEEFPWVQDTLQKDQASTAHSSTDVVYLSDHILRKVPTDRELSRVASLLGGQWETVLLDLELTAEDLYRCRVDHRSDVHGAALEGLVHWRQAQGKRATVQRLVQSLEVADIHLSMLLDTFQ
uniref:Death domain-containing protein n=1 Tax=Knipowitschia caucasica TaxID=637954 RepID=A0AAV2IX92_KNICA